MKSNWQTWLKLYFGTGCFLVLILAASAAPQKKAKPPGTGSANSALTQPAATPSRPTGGGQWENFPLPGSFIMALDRGDGKGFGLLAYDTTPGYTDTTPFPAAPVKWIYRAIYRVADSQVGQWSLPVSVTVPA